MASLAVFDPSPLFRAGLAALASAMGLAPVQEAADLDDLMQREDAARPELMLIGLPRSAAEIGPLMREIRAWAPEAKVVFIAPDLDVPELVACFAAGASGYLIESISREGLKHSLQLVSAGEKVFPSDLAEALGAAGFRAAASGDVGRELRELQVTEREVAVLRRLARGESNHAVAAALEVSETAVSADIRHILRKLGVANRTQAALWAVARGLAPPFVGADPPARRNDPSAAATPSDLAPPGP